MIDVKNPEDLRKEFFAKTGEEPLVELRFDCSDDSYIKPIGIEVPAIEYMKHLEYMVLELRAQLHWRPVSEKPEKEGVYIVECYPYPGCDSTIITKSWYDGERFPWNDVVKWLPIPPEPEGEHND